MSGMGYSMPPYPPFPETEETVDAGLRRDVDMLKKRAPYEEGEEVTAQRCYHHKVFGDDMIVLLGDGRRIWTMPADMNNWVLAGIFIGVSTVSSSGNIEVQIRRMRVSASDQDMLSAKARIDASEFNTATSSQPGTVTGTLANKTVLTGDRVSIDVDLAGANAMGLDVATFWDPPA